VQQKTFAILSVIGSRSKNDVLECLNAGYTHPGEIAMRLKVTRQAVDKAIKDLYGLGMLDRSAVFPPEGRPKILYTINRAGRNLIRALEDAGENFGKDLDERAKEELGGLDAALAEGRMGEEVYVRKRRAIEERRP
jgi:DNA-binding MarR family transcriptional regulator